MAAVAGIEGLGGYDRSPSCDRDSSQNRQIQEIASEVLRLRLVQSQHRQLQGQLRGAAEKLRAMPLESVVQLRRFIELGLRPVGGPGTLGGAHREHSVDPESLLGLMECLCVVCDPGHTPVRKQEDLLVATQWLLQDPLALIEQLISLPAAQSNQSRRLAPFLLSCDGGWRGQLNEAGHCYETLRHWLSCYYQFSLINSQMQATSDQLNQQERLLEELSRDSEGGTGGVGGALFRPSTNNTIRQSSGKWRSSSVQSNESAGSRRSQSPTERSANAGLRPSPRTGAGPTISGRLSTARESPAYSPQKTAPRNSERYTRGGMHSTSNLQRHGAVSSPGRSNSPLQPSSSRTSLHKETKVESSPRAPRFGPPLSMSGTLGSARDSARAHRAGAPPPNPSPRIVANQIEPLKISSASRRQNVPAVRTRRSPSREQSGSSIVNRLSGSLSSRATPLTSRDTTERGGFRAGEARSARDDPHRKDMHEKDMEHDDPGYVQSPSLARCRSLQGIPDPGEATLTPPMSYRGSEVNSARHRSPQQMAPTGLTTPIGRVHTSASTPMQSRHEHRQITSGPSTSGPSRMTRFAAPPTAGSGGTPGGATLRRTQNQHSRSSLQLPSGRRLSPSESANSLRTTDAGSGGTGDNAPHVQPGPWSLALSRSTPALDMRMMSGRLASRDTPNATPRPLTSARAR